MGINPSLHGARVTGAKKKQFIDKYILALNNSK
jgi:hypothetical protein